MKKIKKALISVSNKNNLDLLIRNLVKHKIQIISSGGTYKEIKKLGFKCLEVSNYTGFPELLDGRVKTLHPKIFSGILSNRKKKSHLRDLKKNNFKEIDLVVVNFYPFEKTIKNLNYQKKIIENIDIGGPAMARAAAKNHNDVTVITKIEQYIKLINELKKNRGSTSINFRNKMSEEAFNETAYYDAVIANYFNKKTKNFFPEKKIIFGKLFEKLRYGENPHQNGAIYSLDNNINIKQLNGKQLSYNNYNDIFSALLLSKSFPRNVGTVIVKHANPCGVSINKDKIKSYRLALACDPISTYGGIVSCNFKINKKLAIEFNNIFLEAVIGNGIDYEALKILKKRKNLIVIDSQNLKLESIQNINSNFNSFLVQSPDNYFFSSKNFRIVSKKKPSYKMLKNMIFAFNICRSVKSNGIVLIRNDTTIGIGSGQPSRLDSCKIAINKMHKYQSINGTDQIIAASDAFFPFVDGIETLVQAGITAVIQPSGSIRDKEIIKFANQTGTILVFSNTRHFKH